MNPENIKESIQAVIDGLTPLAQRLQIPLEQVWHWSIKHNYAVAGTWIGVFILALIAGVICYQYDKRLLIPETKKEYFSRSEGIIAGGIFLNVAVSVFLLIAVTGLVGEAIPRLIAPEYYTAQDIVQLIHPNR